MADSPLPIKPEELIAIIKRRWWFIIIPFCLAMVAGTYLAETLPRIYEASTLILIQPPKVPENYVQSIVQSGVEDRINTLSQQILSRTNLEKVIDKYGLFLDPKSASLLREQKVGLLREQITVNATQSRSRGGNTDSFSISVIGENPEKIAEVANGLASSFIDENLRERESQAIGTSQFLDSELQTMRVRLEEVEAILQNYRKTHMGELPEQLDTNLQILEGLQTSLSERRQSLRDLRNELTTLRTTQATTIQIIRDGGDEQEREVLDSNDPEALKERLSILLTRYTDKHPDVVKLKATIARLESAANTTTGTQSAASREPAPAAQRRSTPEETRILLEIQSVEAEIDQIQSQIALYQQRVENTPRREQEVLALRRDYENIQTTYNSLLERKLESDIAVNMEKKQKGEQFRVLDTAKVPVQPVSPNMLRLFLMVIAGGLGLGGGLAFLLEMLDVKVRKPEDVEEMLKLPVLGIMPSVLSARDIFKKRFNLMLSGTSVFVSVFLLGIFTISSQFGLQRAVTQLKEILG